MAATLKMALPPAKAKAAPQLSPSQAAAIAQARTPGAASDPVAANTNAALDTANTRLSAAFPGLGAQPLNKLLAMVSNPKFVEIVRIANQISGKSTRNIGGVNVPMDPVQPGDASLPPDLQAAVLKIRTLAAWMILARFAPILLGQATAQWLLQNNVWDQNKFNAAVSALWSQGTAMVGAAAQAAAQTAYTAAITAWHALQPRDLFGNLVTSSQAPFPLGSAFDAWVASKPPTPPGVPTLAGYAGGIFRDESSLRGLSGAQLKNAYWAMQGLGVIGDDMDDGSNSGGDVTPQGAPPDVPIVPGPGVQDAQNSAGTKDPTSASSGPAGQLVPPVLMTLLENIFSFGAGAVIHTAGGVVATGERMVTGQAPHYAPNGQSTDGGPPLSPPPDGKEYDVNGQLKDKSGTGGFPWGWVLGIGLVGAGVAYSRK